MLNCKKNHLNYFKNITKWSPKSFKNNVQIDAETELGKKVVKWRPRPIESDPIFDQNRSKIISKIPSKINAWKISKNDAKRSEKWAQMAHEINEKSNPKSLLKKAWKNNKKYKIFKPSEPWKTLFSCRKTAILMKSTFSNECRKSMRKSSKKHAKMLPNIYINSFKNLHRKRNAKMVPKCSKKGVQSGHEIDKVI